ncbi:MAG: hypothetical protein F6K40_27735 [Okeania sp. SIO3I5]|uniref:hypothetical protein n=1 Tax=Okeania sp. SIO3I5 TaxID=2607805 RepID=UPI0013B7276C|nr:hypothetical protein [Okeania sp. SIO3I5]NEQ39834.1 hypothetical protein [Okeania sp. SIO3I5]
MDSWRKIELGGLVALLTAIVGLAVYFGRIDAEVKNLKERVKELKDDEIKKAQKEALENFQQEVEKTIEEARREITNQEIENVRTIVTKSDADKICSSKPGSKATYVPFSYIGRTGQEICADNYDGDLKSCSQVPFVWVSNKNTHGRYERNDQDCNEPVQAPWPWVKQYTKPNTNTVRDGRPYANSWVVCCYKL